MEESNSGRRLPDRPDRRLDQRRPAPPNSSHHCVFTVREVVAVLVGRPAAARFAFPRVAGTAPAPAPAPAPPMPPGHPAADPASHGPAFRSASAGRRHAELPYAAQLRQLSAEVKARRWTAHGSLLVPFVGLERNLMARPRRGQRSRDTSLSAQQCFFHR